jgi:hypothetical protein
MSFIEDRDKTKPPLMRAGVIEFIQVIFMIEIVPIDM